MHGETGGQNSGLTGWLSDRTQAVERLSCLQRIQKHREGQPGEWVQASTLAKGAWPEPLVTKGGEAVKAEGLVRSGLRSGEPR